MKKILLLLVLCQVTLYPTYPGTNTRDYSKDGLKVEGNRAYQTYPGTNTIDYGQPWYKVEPDYSINQHWGVRKEPTWKE
jgi:hypothetical protein